MTSKLNCSARPMARASLANAPTRGEASDPSSGSILDPNNPDGTAKQHTEDLLDEALEESFPASDPPSIAMPERQKEE